MTTLSTQLPMCETKIETATRLLQELFGKRTRILISEAMEVGREHDVGERTMARAARSLGIKAIPNGPFGWFWEAEDET